MYRTLHIISRQALQSIKKPYRWPMRILVYSLFISISLDNINASIVSSTPQEPPQNSNESKRIFSQKLNTPSATILSLDKITVLAIDPGHGGVDPGAIGKYGLLEKNVTLKLAKKIRSRLSSIENLFIALTRFDDTTINIESRNKIIETIKADFVVSLHMNSIPQEHTALVETYYDDSKSKLSKFNSFYSKSNHSYRDISRTLASSIQESVFSIVEQHNGSPLNAGIKTNSMRILSQNKALGALLEITCISNPEEEARLRTDKYLNKLAEAITDGIKRFLSTYSGNTSPIGGETLASQNLGS